MTAPDDTPSVPGEENPYLALREAKIRRNEARLRELGLVKSLSSSVSATPRRANDKSRPKQSTTDSESTLTAVRRSKRLSNSSRDINFAKVPDPTQQSLKRPRRTVPTPFEDEASTITKPHDSRQSPSPKQSPPPAPNSVRSISLCTQRLTIGSTEFDSDVGQDKIGILGLPMERAGKEFVIYKSFEVAASLEDHQRLKGARLSFNKYSGVQEWNNCIFLWVNLGANGNTVVNTFLDDGNQITWFGGSKMTDDSPIIEKLIRWGKEATDSSSKIILWCRKFDTSTKAFWPYVCLGRLSYHHHEAGSRPLAFVWNLLDCDRMVNHRDARVQEMFNTFIKL